MPMLPMAAPMLQAPTLIFSTMQTMLQNVFMVHSWARSRWRARLLVPIAAVMIILGVGLILPSDYGSALIGTLPLIIGIWLLSRGLGWEQQLDRLVNDMRAAATGSLLGLQRTFWSSG